MTLNKQIGRIKMYEVTGKADDLAKRILRTFPLSMINLIKSKP